MCSIKEGDIVLAPFRFSENNDAKLRPCLVWKMTPVSVVLIYISSQKIDKAFPTEVILTSDQSAKIGLAKASRIDFGKRDKCLLVDVVRVVGDLSGLPRGKLRECFEAANAAGLIDE